MPIGDVSALVVRELDQLPDPRAPRTLLPRVMAAVQAWVSRPWYQRAWLTWPRGWQLASAIVLAMLVSGLALLIPDAGAAARGLTVSVATSLGVATNASGLVQQIGAAGTAMEVVWRSLVEPVAMYAAALVVLIFLAGITVASALDRVTGRRTLFS
jgi:hypothetical protein